MFHFELEENIYNNNRATEEGGSMDLSSHIAARWSVLGHQWQVGSGLKTV